MYVIVINFNVIITKRSKNLGDFITALKKLRIVDLGHDLGDQYNLTPQRP